MISTVPGNDTSALKHRITLAPTPSLEARKPIARHPYAPLGFAAARLWLGTSAEDGSKEVRGVDAAPRGPQFVVLHGHLPKAYCDSPSL